MTDPVNPPPEDQHGKLLDALGGLCITAAQSGDAADDAAVFAEILGVRLLTNADGAAPCYRIDPNSLPPGYTDPYPDEACYAEGEIPQWEPWP